MLTDDILRDLCRADQWGHADFTLVLDAGVRDGRLKKLGSKFYELAEPPAR